LDKWASITNTAVSNLELHLLGGPKQIERYFKGLKDDRCPNKITQGQAEFLETLIELSREFYKTRATKCLKQINFEYTKNYYANPSLKYLIEKLNQQYNPAFIIDPLWFIHALNEPALYMFSIDPYNHEHPDTKYLYRWEAWHVMATKFQPDSPVRKAHLLPKRYFRPVIDIFFHHENTYPFLFTDQMRWLLCKLHLMSNEHGYEFTGAWHEATALDLTYEPEYLKRRIEFQDKEITIESKTIDTVEVFKCGNIEINFSLIIWKPLKEYKEFFKREMNKFRPRHVPIFAATYDQHKNFHVNNWDEMAEI